MAPRFVTLSSYIDEMLEELKKETELLNLYKTQMSTDIITGRINPDDIVSTTREDSNDDNEEADDFEEVDE